MTEVDAIKILQNLKSIPLLAKKLTKQKDTPLTAYLEKEAEAIGIAIDALEAQVPKKLGIWNGQYQCPACESQFGNKDDVDDMANAKKPYCHFCGQALEWGDR